MCYLENHTPDDLMREDFRLNCERIYDEMPQLHTYKSYYDLYNSSELQEILEARNDLYLDIPPINPGYKTVSFNILSILLILL